MLPVLRVLTDLRKGATPEEYGRAKQAFLEGVEKTGYAIVDLARQVDEVTTKQKSEAPVAESATSTDDTKEVSETTKTLPGLQDLKGGWHGLIRRNRRKPSFSTLPVAIGNGDLTKLNASKLKAKRVRAKASS